MWAFKTGHNEFLFIKMGSVPVLSVYGVFVKYRRCYDHGCPIENCKHVTFNSKTQGWRDGSVGNVLCSVRTWAGISSLELICNSSTGEWRWAEKTPSVNLWPPQACAPMVTYTLHTPTLTSTCTPHIHAQRERERGKIWVDGKIDHIFDMQMC